MLDFIFVDQNPFCRGFCLMKNLCCIFLWSVCSWNLREHPRVEEQSSLWRYTVSLPRNMVPGTQEYISSRRKEKDMRELWRSNSWRTIPERIFGVPRNSQLRVSRCMHAKLVCEHSHLKQASQNTAKQAKPGSIATATFGSLQRWQFHLPDPYPSFWKWSLHLFQGGIPCWWP